MISDAGSLDSCSEFHTHALTCEADQAHYSEPILHSCKKRYCPICAHQRAAELLTDYTPIVTDALVASPVRFKLRHITLTTPWALTDDHIFEKYRAVWKMVYLCMEQCFGKKARYWKESMLGFIGGAEFGGEGLKLHVHLLVLSPWIDHELLTEAWKIATNGECYITHIRLVDDVKEGVQEVLKYATKISELPPGLVPRLALVLARSRRVRAAGVFTCKLQKIQRERPCCPVCGGQTVIKSLLDLKQGNNFASPRDAWKQNVPVIAPHPPPEMLRMPFLRGYEAFFDSPTNKKR